MSFLHPLLYTNSRNGVVSPILAQRGVQVPTEAHNPEPDVVFEVQEALEAGSFEFGVDSTELGFRFTLNSIITGVYLHPDPDEFRRTIDSAYEAVICPSETRAGTIEHNDGENIVIYVSPGDYKQFSEDARVVHELYNSGDLCFRSIPKDLYLLSLGEEACTLIDSLGQ